MRASLQTAARMWSRCPLPVGPAVMVLGYHRIDDIDDELAVHTRPFAAQMEWLASQRCEVPVLSLENALRRLAGEEPSTNRAVVVTIDDAWADVHANGLEVLVRAAVSATMYVPSRLLGTPGYMTRDQVVEMHRAGISIGAHSRSHADLRRCTETELEAEVRGCREDLEALLGQEVTSFAYPYGSEDGRVRHAVIEAGYTSAVTTRRGWTRGGCDRFRVPRNFIEQFDLRVFRAATRGGLNVLAPLDAVRGLNRW